MKSSVAAAVCGMLATVAGTAAYMSPVRLEAARAPKWVAPLSSRDVARIAATRTARARISPESLTTVVRSVCAECHNEDVKAGDLSLETFDVAAAAKQADVAERMIKKLETGMMPPPEYKKKPDPETLRQLAATLESNVDNAAAANPNPGVRTFQRLNRAEYSRSIRDILAIDVDAGSWLPLDTKSANFDNIADVQTPSATTLDGYLDAASEISRLAVGDPTAKAKATTYKVPRLASQWDHVDGAPMGTRGGVSVVHNFPADGEYVFAVSLQVTPTGQLYGSASPIDEKIEISVNGERVALMDIDRGMSQADPNGMEIKTPAIPVRSGPQRVTAAFIRTFDGPVNDNIAPIGHSIADTEIGHQYGITNLPHLSDFTVRGPFNPTGVSETPSRKKIFVCRPTAQSEERPCAEKIVASLGEAAYRRPLAATDVKSLMKFYDEGARDGGFESGVRTALEAVLSSPHFIFRFEERPSGKTKPGDTFAISSIDLASRLSFFLWGEPPDSTLIAVAEKGNLNDPATLEAQTKRMLADPRSAALGTRFAAQWLRLQDIDKVHPDVNMYPDYREQLGQDMRRETVTFFNSIVRENKSVLDLFSANYTYVNEALAKHYGIPGVVGPEFRRVEYPDASRRGLLGQGSILTLTSHANRTSPVLRGKWVMEVLLSSPPPPPPPGVPDLEKTGDAKDGRLLTTRERMEMHRANPTCRSCHLFMDPIGLALDNFDVTGQWRIRENGAPLDTHGQLYDGTQLASLSDLQTALLKRPTPLIRTFTTNLMAYALGRRVEYYDQPTVRKIANAAAADGYKMSDFIVGVVKSDAFRMGKVAMPQAAESGR